MHQIKDSANPAKQPKIKKGLDKIRPFPANSNLIKQKIL